MKPEDMSKKRFKLIPGEDYENGPISEHGTFGNMLKTKMAKSLKASADNMPGGFKDGKWDGKITDEQMMNITDFVNPVRGMYVAAKSLGPGFSSKTFSDVITKKPMEWIDDKGAKLLSNKEFAQRERDTYYPKDLSDLYRSDDYSAYANKQQEYLNDLVLKRDAAYEAGNDIEGAKLNTKIDWIVDEDYMLKLMEDVGPRTYGEALVHPKLFKSQPDLYDKPFTREGRRGGAYSPDTKSINIGTEEGTDVMLHEIQHAIQNKEGWPRGGNVNEFKRKYNHQRRRLSKIISKQEANKMVGEGYDSDIHQRAVNIYDSIPAPEEKYRSLYGEQQSRAVQEFFNDPEVRIGNISKQNKRRDGLFKQWKELEEELKGYEAGSADYDDTVSWMETIAADYKTTSSYKETTPFHVLTERESGGRGLPNPLIKRFGSGRIIGDQ